MNTSRHFIFFLILVVCTNCNNKPEHKIRQGERKFSIPKTFLHKNDVLVDSMFIDIPSEGTIVKIFTKENNDKLYVANAIATMNTYNYEIYTKGDSIFILQHTRNYNQPLTIPGAKTERVNHEYVSYTGNTLIIYVKNDTIIKDKSKKAIKNKESLYLIETILSKVKQ